MDSAMDTINSSEMEKQQALERKVRIKELMDDAAKIEKQLPQQSSIETLEAVKKILSSSDAIYMEGNSEERAKHSTEVVMDAQLLKRSHELVSKALQQESVFNEHIYQSSINRHVFRGDAPDWNVIAEIACGLAHTVHVQSSMLGAIEEELMERTIRQRQRKRTSLAAEKRPEIVEQLTSQDKGAEKINIIHKQLQQIFKDNGCKPIPFYKLIIDPDNFMNTVENAFQLSFLARDNIIGFEKGDDNYPEVRLATTDERKRDIETSQSMCTLNYALCRDMIIFYNINEPMLKPQPQMESGTSSQK